MILVAALSYFLAVALAGNNAMQRTARQETLEDYSLEIWVHGAVYPKLAKFLEENKNNPCVSNPYTNNGNIYSIQGRVVRVFRDKQAADNFRASFGASEESKHFPRPGDVIGEIELPFFEKISYATKVVLKGKEEYTEDLLEKVKVLPDKQTSANR